MDIAKLGLKTGPAPHKPNALELALVAAAVDPTLAKRKPAEAVEIARRLISAAQEVIDRPLREENKEARAVGVAAEEIAGMQRTSRELSVCGHVVANDELLVVEDLSRDRRFANNPLLSERGLRFYAGVPLRSNNLPIGSLCILDVKPRRMTEREERLLEVIAEDVMEEIQRRDNVGSLSLR